MFHNLTCVFYRISLTSDPACVFFFFFFLFLLQSHLLATVEISLVNQRTRTQTCLTGGGHCCEYSWQWHNLGATNLSFKWFPLHLLEPHVSTVYLAVAFCLQWFECLKVGLTQEQSNLTIWFHLCYLGRLLCWNWKELNIELFLPLLMDWRPVAFLFQIREKKGASKWLKLQAHWNNRWPWPRNTRRW